VGAKQWGAKPQKISPPLSHKGHPCAAQGCPLWTFVLNNNKLTHLKPKTLPNENETWKNRKNRRPGSSGKNLADLGKADKKHHSGYRLKKPASIGKCSTGTDHGAADDDPSGIATYSQTGARAGVLIYCGWRLLTFPLMAVVHGNVVRASGWLPAAGWPAILNGTTPKNPVYVRRLLFFANTFNLGADLGAMAKATQLLWPNFSFTLLIFFFTLKPGFTNFYQLQRLRQYLKMAGFGC